MLATNATDKLNNDLKNANVLEVFDTIVNSSEIGWVKPDEQFYTTAMSQINLSASESVFIDDSIANVNSAKKLGFTVIHHHNY